MMALTLFVVVASQINKLHMFWGMIIQVIPIYIAFMLIMPLISRAVAKMLQLDIGMSRAVIFSGGTRNSLVVLPLALALPNEWSTLVAAIIVTQTMVELVGEPTIRGRIYPALLAHHDHRKGDGTAANPTSTQLKSAKLAIVGICFTIATRKVALTI